MRSVTEEQRSRRPARVQPAGLLNLWRCRGVAQRSIKDILPPRALLQCQISSNASAPYL
jgi:hypothetical protein